jgi:hypothetical protein
MHPVPLESLVSERISEYHREARHRPLERAARRHSAAAAPPRSLLWRLVRRLVAA